MAVNFANEVSLSYTLGLFKIPYNLVTWGRQLYLLSERSRAMALKIHRLRPGLNPRTLGPTAIAITVRSPRPTWHCALHTQITDSPSINHGE
jgi:hypothetical protein